jgi:hypothetical protein
MSKVFEYTLNELPTAYVDGSLSGSGSATIEIYDGDGNSISLDSNSCTELGSTGVFVFQLSNFTTTPTSYSVYTYIISRGANDFFGTIKIGSQEVPANLCKVTLSVFDSSDCPLDSNQVFSVIGDNTAKIKESYYQSATLKNFIVKEVYPSVDNVAGEMFWTLPQGASVVFNIPLIGLTKEVVIPDSSEANLNDIAAV